MARRVKTNPHETQAKLSLLLAVIGGLSALALIVCVFWRFDFGEFTSLYAKGSLRFYAVLGATAVGVAASGIGFFVALNSAGQQRNRLSGLAWKTFFINALVGAVTLCVFVIFWFAKEAVR